MAPCDGRIHKVFLPRGWAGVRRAGLAGAGERVRWAYEYFARHRHPAPALSVRRTHAARHWWKTCSPAWLARTATHIWISRLDADTLRAYASKLEGQDIASLPLYGIPFAIKDNIDLAGLPTTAGCPEYAYTPEQHATVVQRLIDAGAIPLGKTNLDQFATGSQRHPLALRRLPQRLQPGLHFRRLQFRLGGRRGARPGELQPRHRYRRLRPRARRVQQPGRPQAELRRAVDARRGARLPLARCGVDLRADGRGCRARAGGRRRLRCRR